MTTPVNPFSVPDEKAIATIPSIGARPDEGLMDADELQTIVDGLITHSVQYVDSELSPQRAKATEYYQGKPFGNEEDGRSQYVSTDVRDGVLAMLPSLLRVVFGAERPLDFAPNHAEDVAAAEQATEYVNYVFSIDNPGFLLTHAVLKDGLTRKVGVYKYGWDESSERCAYRQENVAPEQIEQLLSDPESEIELTRVEPSQLAPGMFDIEFTRQEKDGRARVWVLPPEELIFTQDSRSATDTVFIGHRTDKSRGELIAMGVDPKLLDETGTADGELEDHEENLARKPDGATGDAPEAGEANDKIRYVEGYARIDYDGDGIAELRRICTVGTGNKVASNDPVDSVPFAVFCPDPEPHTLVGLSLADRLMDIQKTKSMITRSMLDSLALSIFPRLGYVDGQVNVQDVMSTAIGSPIRMRAPGMLQPVTHDFVGREGFPFLQYFDDVIERRTGRNQAAAGLDADALQSTTKSAADAAVSASQEQIELIARIFVETTLKPLFRGILKLLVTHQPRARLVRLRNQWVDVDPRSWDADMDVTVNVALGSGLVEQKIATLLAIKETQEGILQLLGPQNPMVTLSQYRYTLAKIIELQGWKDTTKFFNEIDEQQLAQQQAAAAQQPPPPSPEMVLAQAQIQIEHMKAERELAMKQAELELRAREIQLEDDRERDRAASEHVRELTKIELDHKAKLNDAELRAEVQKERATNQAAPTGAAE